MAPQAGSAVDWYDVGVGIAEEAREGTLIGYAEVLAYTAAFPILADAGFPDRLGPIACAFDDVRARRTGIGDAWDEETATDWMVVELTEGGGAGILVDGLTRSAAEIRARQENALAGRADLPWRCEVKRRPAA